MSTNEKEVVNSELLPEGTMVFTPCSLLLYNEQYYNVVQLNDDDAFTISRVADGDVQKEYNDPLFDLCRTLFEANELTVNNEKIIAMPEYEYNDHTAYIVGNCFFIFRGECNRSEAELVGLYQDAEGFYVRIPSSIQEFQEFCPDGKLSRSDINDIRDAINNHEIVIMVNDVSSSSIIEENDGDDLFKRLIKRALRQKGVDLDECRTRFISKNTLFNTKQVLRGPNRLSVLIFDRCIEGLGLDYTITISESGGETVGIPLSEPIVLSSSDTYNIDLDNVDETYVRKDDAELDEEDDEDIDV